MRKVGPDHRPSLRLQIMPNLHDFEMAISNERCEAVARPSPTLEEVRKQEETRISRKSEKFPKIPARARSRTPNARTRTNINRYIATLLHRYIATSLHRYIST